MFNFIKNNGDTKEIHHKEIEYDVSQVNLEFKKAESELQKIKKLLKDTKISADVEINSLNEKINYYRSELDKLQDTYYKKIFSSSGDFLEDYEIGISLKSIEDTRMDFVKQNKVFIYDVGINGIDIDFEKIILRGLDREFANVKNEILKGNSKKYLAMFDSMLNFYVKICDEKYFKIDDDFIKTYIDEFHLHEKYVESKAKQSEENILNVLQNKKRREINSIRNKFEKDMRRTLENQKSYLKKFEQESDKSKREFLKEKLLKIENYIMYLKEKDNYIKYQENKLKSGYLYILSNVRSYGNEIFKICSTGSLFPFDEIKKLNKFTTPYEHEPIYLNLFDDIEKIYNEIYLRLKSNVVRKINRNSIFFKCSKRDIEKLILELNNSEAKVFEFNNK